MSDKTKPRIGIDVTALAKSQAGIARYGNELLKRLIRNMSSIHFFLYSPSPVRFPLFELPNVTIRTGTFRIKYTSTLWTQLAMPRLVAQDKIDIFWSLSPRPPLLLSSKITSVVTIHDFVWKIAPGTMTRFGWLLDSILSPISIRRCSHIFCVSNSTKNDLMRFFPREIHKVSVTPLASSLKPLLSQQSRDERVHPKDYFLFVGTLEPRKNLARLIEAFSLVSSELRDGVNLVIVGGGGWGKVNVTELAKKNKIENKVVYLGGVTDGELRTLYSQALFLAFPSLYEGFGIPIVEAMSSGIPVLTSNRSSMPEVAGGAGFFVDPESTSDIKRGIETLLGDDAVRASLRSSCQSQVAKYSWDATASLTAKRLNLLLIDRKVGQ